MDVAFNGLKRKPPYRIDGPAEKKPKIDDAMHLEHEIEKECLPVGYLSRFNPDLQNQILFQMKPQFLGRLASTSIAAGKLAKAIIAQIKMPIIFYNEAVKYFKGMEDSVTFLHANLYSNFRSPHNFDTWPFLYLKQLNYSCGYFGGKQLLNLSSLQSLTSAKVSTKSLKSIFKMSTLTELSLDKLACLSSTDFMPLKNMSRLTHLTLNLLPSKTNILKVISSLSNLEHFQTKNNYDFNKDTYIFYLNGLTRLKFLSIDAQYLTESALIRISHLTNLQHLALEYCSGIKGGLHHLTNLTSLTFLNLKGGRLPRKEVEHLKGLTYLRHLHLWNCADTICEKSEINQLTTLVHLETLHSTGFKLNDEDLSTFSKMNIRSLEIYGELLTEKGFKQIGNMSTIKSLFLTECDRFKLSDNAFAHLGNLTKLRELEVDDTANLTAAVMDTLTKLSKLRILSVFGDKLDFRIDNITQLTILKKRTV